MSFLRAAATAIGSLVAAAALAQVALPQAASAPDAAASAAQRVEILGTRSDSEQRRQSTAAKIVIGREELERQGDSTIGEILKRLPGITIGGAPGRGGAIRMRGLGAGYTQILLDGDRVPPGFSIDSLGPEQIERIEILRAPTAETGGRAIGGTINIITREGYSRKVNDVRVDGQVENGSLGAGLNWTRNNLLSQSWTMNSSLSIQSGKQESDSVTTTTDTDLGSGAVTREQIETASSLNRRVNLHLGVRLQYQGRNGEVGFLAPFLVVNRSDSQRDSRINEPIVSSDPARAKAYDNAQSNSDNRFEMLRMLGQWRHTVGDGLRLEWRGNGGGWRSVSHTLRNEFSLNVAQPVVIHDDARIDDKSFSLNLKASKLLSNDHSLVTGVETEGVRRTEDRTTVLDNTALLADFDGNLQATTTRLALYAQDEWNLSPTWAAHAGLRWEGISTRGAGADGTAPTNHSSVWTPLLHAVWKPAPQSRDQVRMSLTRSYRAPSINNLIGRPRVNFRYPPPAINTATTPDFAGNPALKPELATGVDIAFERYLGAGGVLSANLFYRQVHDLMRGTTELETNLSCAPQRWVNRPKNIGDAMTQGLELEAKFRLTELWPEAVPADVRANLSLFNSRVASVPGPDNRLDSQPNATANLGADYRLRSLPLTLGGNLNWTPAYDTQLSAEQSARQGRKLVFDAYALWAFKPGVQLRLSATNLDPQDYLTGGSLESSGSRESTRSVNSTYTTWQLRLELKL